MQILIRKTTSANNFKYLLQAKHYFPAGTSGKEHSCQFRKGKKHGFDPSVGKIPGEGDGNLLQYSCLVNSMDRGAWHATQSVGSQRVGKKEAHTYTHTDTSIISGFRLH